MNQPLIVEHTYNAPINVLWKALTDKNQLKQWYFDMLDFKPEVGCRFTFTGTDNEGVSYLHVSEVVEVVPNKKLVYTWGYDGYEGNSLVTWELSDEKNTSKVILTHSGIETFPSIPAFAKENFVAGWSEILGTNLREMVETETMKRTIPINATAAKVWKMLTDSAVNRQWSDAFGEGVYVEATWDEGTEVKWFAQENLLVKGIVDKCIPEEILKVVFYDDADQSQPDPTGEYLEMFQLNEESGTTVLSITAGPLPIICLKDSNTMWDKAIEKMVALAENH
ncbi:MAG: SRPBCC family protein [Chitinophagales bacterium]|nr:SRPBCC family protein [Chitinophagales bacterium]